MASEEEPPTMGHDEAIVEEKVDQSTPQLSESSAIGVDDADGNTHTESPKIGKILDACRRRDIEELQSLAESPGGFMTDGLRQQACELRFGYSCRLHLRHGAISSRFGPRPHSRTIDPTHAPLLMFA